MLLCCQVDIYTLEKCWVMVGSVLVVTNSLSPLLSGLVALYITWTVPIALLGDHQQGSFI